MGRLIRLKISGERRQDKRRGVIRAELLTSSLTLVGSSGRSEAIRLTTGCGLPDSPAIVTTNTAQQCRRASRRLSLTLGRTAISSVQTNPDSNRKITS